MDKGFISHNTTGVGHYDLLCFSHLRWDFVYQRPQHLLSRFAKDRRVFFIEEPLFHYGDAELKISRRENGLHVVTPHFSHGEEAPKVDATVRRMVGEMLNGHGVQMYAAWYYTPMLLPWGQDLRPLATIYDCMDELSMFKNAPKALIELEAELFGRADHVFTGGRSLYEAKAERHPSVHCFPSSIDAEHFATAMEIEHEPEDQAHIPHPRIGFYGVIDERSDLELLARIAELRPSYHFIMIGPVVKIDEADLPRRENLHYPGGKDYKDLPKYLAGWDAAMMPFALNDSTRFISPTKTPEFLAAGLPVVSTPVRDVVRPYGENGLVRIAGTPQEFVRAIDAALEEDQEERRRRVDEFLADMSWDNTYKAMAELVHRAVEANSRAGAAATV